MYSKDATSSCSSRSSPKEKDTCGGRGPWAVAVKSFKLLRKVIPLRGEIIHIQLIEGCPMYPST